MLRKTLFAAVCGAFVLAGATSDQAAAQYVGGQAVSAKTTVADVLKNGVDDQRVVLQGNVLRRLYGDKYIFSDGTGEIRVDIDTEEWPPGQQISESTRVEIIGKVDVDWGRVTEIDVKVLRVVK